MNLNISVKVEYTNLNGNANTKYVHCITPCGLLLATVKILQTREVVK